MSVLHSAGLPAGFTLEPATGVHATEIFAVCEAEMTEAYGFCPDTVEDTRADLEPPEVTDSYQHVVRDADGSVVQWWAAIHDPGDPIVYTWNRSHPHLPPAAADELARTWWATTQPWIRSHAEDGDGPIDVHSGSPGGSAAGHRHLAAAGFTHQRTFWEMLGPVTDTTRAKQPVPGLTIVATDNARTLHQVLNDGLAGHWGFTPLEYDAWLEVQQSLSGADPNLWFLAAVDGTPAAAMLLSRRAQADGAMYVAELATLEPYRRRGIASALLAHAFDLAAGEGLGQLSLHVDSENSHDAPSLYRKAGLEVRCAFHGYTRVLTR